MKEKTELFYISSQSPLAGGIDVGQILALSQAEDMQPLTKAVLAEHEMGLFVTEGLGKDSLAVGYIALKAFETLQNDKCEQTGAVVGSLCLVERYRGQGIGRGLVETIISKAFTVYQNVDYCAANCNLVSLQSFSSQGFTVIGPAGVKHAVKLQRADWDIVSVRC